MSNKLTNIMTRRLGYLLTLVAFGVLTMAQASEVPDVTDPKVVEAFVDGVVKPSMQEHHTPSGVVAVMKDGKMIFAKGYGYIDVEKRIPVDPKTSLFRPGSISKLFTWVSVMQQVEQGKLDLDTDVNTYLTRVNVADSWPGQPVTLRHIMTHTAGFEDGALGYLIVDDPKRIIPLAESLIEHQPIRVNPPGEHVAYSNWATALAGLMVANVSGQDFNSYVQEHIFDVLGMSHSSFVEPLPPELDATMAKAYSYAADQFTEMNYEIVANFGPAGAMATTAYDMSLFAQALLNEGEYDGNRILQAATLKQMLEQGFSHDERVRGTGLGFLKRRFGPEGFDNFGHDGATSVFVSHFGLSKKENFMLFSSFSGVEGARGPHNALVKAFYDQFFPHAVAVIEPPADFAQRADNYVGTYNNWRNSFSKAESLARLISGTEVSAMPDNTLMIGTSRYVEVEPNLFRQVDDYGRIAFQQDAAGQITGYVIDGMGVMQFYKAPFYETMGFTSLLMGLSVLVFISVFIRLAYQWNIFKQLPYQEKNAFRASIAVASFNLLFLITFAMGLSVGETALLYAIPTMLKVSFIFPILALIATLYHVFCAKQVWSLSLLKGRWARIRYTLVSICSLFMLWFYYYWNLFGSQY